MRGYHFFGDTLRDGTPVPEDGIKLIYDGVPELCYCGYHFSLDPFDALQYAPGANLALVEVGGEGVFIGDKGVATERTIIRRIDATDLLREFARWCPLQVIDLWDAPSAVREYLETGDESLREDASAAAAARAADAADAAWEVAWAARASWDAVRDAQRSKFNEMVKEAGL